MTRKSNGRAAKATAIALLLIFPCIDYLTAQPARELLEQARQKEAWGVNLAEAYQMYAKILQSYPNEREVSAEALFRSAHCLERLGRIDEARESFQRITKEYADFPRWVARARIALFRVQPGDFYRQTHEVEVAPDGTVKFFADMRRKNTFPTPIQEDRFHTNMGKLLEVWSPDGAQLPFWPRQMGDGFDIIVQLHKAVPPGGEISYRAVYQMDGLLSRKDHALLYHYGPHYPGPDTLYQHTLKIPPQSELLAAEPRPVAVESMPEHKILIWQKHVPQRGYVEVRAEFLFPGADAFILSLPDYLESLHRQSNVIAIRPDGTTIAEAEFSHRNNRPAPVDAISLRSGARAKMIRIIDQAGRELQFTATPGERQFFYMVKLPDPIQPGEEATFKCYYEMQGLVTRNGDVWTYRYDHSPGPETLYSHTLILPVNADIVSVSPEPDNQERKRDSLKLTWTSILKARTSFHCEVKYKLTAGNERR